MIPDHVFRAIREHKVIIFEDGSVYDRDKVPLWILDLIDEWILELRQLIVDSDWRLCANYQLHRQHFKRVGKDRMICEMCQQFRESIQSQQSKNESEGL